LRSRTDRRICGKPIRKGRRPMTALKIALIQMRSGRHIAANVESVLMQVEHAARAGAKLIATPEMTTLLERDRDRFRAEMQTIDTNEIIAAFASAAKAHGVYLLIGSMPVALENQRFANRSFLFAPDGTLVATYDKMHLFDVAIDGNNMWTESALYAGGSDAVLVETPLANIGLSICYDLRFAALYRSLAQMGAQILTIPSAFTRPTGEAHWHALLRARAIETGCFVLAPAQGGVHEDGRETYGHSLVIDPWGAVIAEAQHDSPECLYAELSLDQVDAARRRLPSLNHDRAFQLKRVQVQF
jgi:deaminated glutathione amidase